MESRKSISSGLSLPQWMKTRINDRLDFDESTFSPPQNDDSFLYIKYPRRESRGDNTTNTTATNEASTSSTTDFNSQANSITSSIANIDISKHTTSCKNYILGQQNVQAPILPLSTPSPTPLKPAGVDDGFKGDGASCGTSIIRVANQMVSGGKVTQGFTTPSNPNTASSFPSEISPNAFNSNNTSPNSNKSTPNANSGNNNGTFTSNNTNSSRLTPGISLLTSKARDMLSHAGRAPSVPPEISLIASEASSESRDTFNSQEDSNNFNTMTLEQEKEFLRGFSRSARRGSKSLPASPLGSPRTSPKLVRKFSANKFFSNAVVVAQEGKQSSASEVVMGGGGLLALLTKRDTFTRSSSNITEEEVTKKLPATITEESHTPKPAVVKAKPSQLREMNFWSPTSM